MAVLSFHLDSSDASKSLNETNEVLKDRNVPTVGEAVGCCPITALALSPSAICAVCCVLEAPSNTLEHLMAWSRVEAKQQFQLTAFDA